jgi:hypothetical protein
MRTPVAVALAVLLSTQAVAAEGGPRVSSEVRVRGWVTSLGVSLLGLGFAGLGLGVGAMMNASDANQMLSAYYPTPESAPTAAEAPVVNQLNGRRASATTLGVASLVAGGVLVAGGLACVLFDGAGGPSAQVTFAPAPGGGTLVLSGRF